MHVNFTDRAKKVMQLANEEAQRLKHDYIGTEHILLGLVREGSGVAANALINLEVDLEKVQRQVDLIVMPGQWPTSGKPPMTPRAKKAIEYAIEEARRLNHDFVGTEHLLLGLFREGEGVAGQVLMNMGLNLESVRKEVVLLLGTTPDRVVTCEPRRVQPLAPIRHCTMLLDVILDLLQQVVEDAVTRQDFEFAARTRDERTKLLTVREFLARQQPESHDRPK